MLTILIGDLTQLGPVKAGMSITASIMDIFLDNDLRKLMPKKGIKKKKPGETVLPCIRKEDMKYNTGNPYVTGAKIMTQARVFEMTEQHRSEDPVHTKLVGEMYQGKGLSFEKLKNNGYSILSQKDEMDKSWAKAPVLVCTNRERYTLTAKRAIQYGKAFNVPVIRWLCNYDKWQNKPPDEHEADALQDPCFYEIFVPG
jgi:hypothetical protein